MVVLIIADAVGTASTDTANDFTANEWIRCDCRC